jgi:Holliday junction resolvase YEN1
MSVPFLPLFIFDGPKRPKVKRGKRISGEKHWLVDSMKGMIEAFGYEWRMVRSSFDPKCCFLEFTLAPEGSRRSRGRAGPPE